MPNQFMPSLKQDASVATWQASLAWIPGRVWTIPDESGIHFKHLQTQTTQETVAAHAISYQVQNAKGKEKLSFTIGCARLPQHGGGSSSQFGWKPCRGFDARSRCCCSTSGQDSSQTTTSATQDYCQAASTFKTTPTTCNHFMSSPSST